MEKGERVFAVMKHEPADGIPCYFTTHFTREVVFGQAAMKEHLKFFREINPGIQKIMSEHLALNMGSIKTAEDQGCARATTPKDKFMGDEIELVERVLDWCGRDAFNIGTLHGIVASTIYPIEPDYGYVPVRRLLHSHLRQSKGPVLDVTRWIADGLCQPAGKFAELGLNDILYVGLRDERSLFTDQESEEYTMPFNKQTMKACLEAGGHSILHMCKTDVNFDWYDSYKGLYSIANWSIYETGVSLTEGRKRFADYAIIGGLPNHKGPLTEGTPGEIRQKVRRVMAEAGKTGFTLGTGCAIPMRVSYGRMRIVVEAIKQGPNRGKSTKVLAKS